jgi:hypothetical protein
MRIDLKLHQFVADGAYWGRCPRRILIAGLALAVSALTTSTASADITFYDVFKAAGYQQTNDSQPSTTVGYFGTVGVDSNNPGDLTGVTVTSSSSLSPMTLSSTNGFNFVGFTPSAATANDLNVYLPNNDTYTFAITGGNFDGQSASLMTPPADAYAATVPYFTNGAYTSLQGVNVGSAINLFWNPYAAPAGITDPLIFVNIRDALTGQSVFDFVGDNTMTSTTVTADTLLAGTQYDLNIVYSSRIFAQDAGFGNATAFVAYDVRTDLLFTTASQVPEPSSCMLLACGAGLIAVAKCRRRTQARS